ncbi:MAG TPA: hypothetical protein VHD60_02470 [Candidatus Saccharimonadales bacterium]|nr:hypothetical protein [Candidatus Saccharimonadales bacterium]
MSKEHVIQAVTNHLADSENGFIAGTPEAFVCIYGSSVYGTPDSQADVDLLCAVPDTHVEGIDVEALGAFIHDTHVRYGHYVDQEVPYANKLVYSFSDLRDAVTLQAFERDTRGSVFVPEIQKTSDFLSSRPIKLRLGLNALTTPNILICKEDYVAKCYLALAGMSITAVGVSLSEKECCDANDVIAAICVSKTEASGEMFLGYKLEHASVHQYLQTTIKRALQRLAVNGYITELKDKPGTYEVGEAFDAFELTARIFNAFEEHKELVHE